LVEPDVEPQNYLVLQTVIGNALARFVTRGVG